MADDCSKHPINVKGYNSIDELAEEIGKLNYFSNRKLYNKLVEIYKRQSKEDEKRGNKQLSSDLEELSKAFDGPVSKAISKVCKTCKGYLKNPYENSENN
jgi:hypothetical protein